MVFFAGALCSSNPASPVQGSPWKRESLCFLTQCYCRSERGLRIHMFACITNQSHKGSYSTTLQMVRRSFNGQQYALSICVCFMAVCGFVRKDERGWGCRPTDCQNALSAESSCWLCHLHVFCFYPAILSAEKEKEGDAFSLKEHLFRTNTHKCSGHCSKFHCHLGIRYIN